MKLDEFVQGVENCSHFVAGMPRLKLVLKEQTALENIVLMGRGALDYSRHRDSMSGAKSKTFFPCHQDHTEHKNSC